MKLQRHSGLKLTHVFFFLEKCWTWIFREKGTQNKCSVCLSYALNFSGILHEVVAGTSVISHYRYLLK